MRPYVTKLESNVKTSVVAQPGRKTLILGRNRTGKSAHVNALEAAGSGKVSDVAGRALLAKDADLSMLSHADRVWALAKLSDGSQASWSLEKGHRAKREGPAIAFPLRDVREAILGSPETARKWVLEVAGQSITWGEIETLIPESLRPLLQNADVIGTEAMSSIRLTAALDHAKARVREATAEARAQRTVTAPPGPPPSDEEVARLEGIVRGWEARGATPAIDPVRDALKVAQENAERLAKTIASAEAELATLKITPTSRLRTAAVEVVEALAASKATSCILCGGACKPEAMAQRAAAGRAQITQDAKAVQRKLDLEFTLREAMADISGARREVARLTEEEARISRLSRDQEAKGVPLPISKEEAQKALRDALERRAGWAASRRAEERALEAERAAVEWGQLADALAKALGTLVEKARGAFEARVQHYLPPGMVFGVDLLDGDREVLRVGLRKGSLLDAALSGAEWASVTSALALATAPATGPCLVIPDETHANYDAETLSEVLEIWDRALQGDDAPQIVVVSPTDPTRIPAGWTVIKTGKGAPAPGVEIVKSSGDEPPVRQSVLPSEEKPAPKRRGRSKGSKKGGSDASLEEELAEKPPVEEKKHDPTLDLIFRPGPPGEDGIRGLEKVEPEVKKPSAFNPFAEE